MQPDPLIQDEDYASSEDSDFAPDQDGAPDQHDSSASGSEDEGGEDAATGASNKKQKKRKHAPGDTDVAEAEDAGFENSGDEAIIQKGRKRRKKAAQGKGAADRDGDEDEDGGEGGLIKTRSQRAIEKAERKIQVTSGPVTVDVDAIWARMTSGPVGASPSKAQDKSGARDQVTLDSSPARAAAQPVAISQPEKEASDTVRIKRTYNFAGRVHTEEKVVARDSAEARLYLASLGENAEPDAETNTSPKRMPRRAFRSVFEPITDQLHTRSDLNLGMSVRIQARELAREAGAKKLNTVEKSRMDWAGYVDKEGIKDELELAGKSKASYAERQDFLARSEARREEDARRARVAGRV